MHWRFYFALQLTTNGPATAGRLRIEREGDEARVVLVGAQERLGQQLGPNTRVVRGSGVLQPIVLHWPKVLQSG